MTEEEKQKLAKQFDRISDVTKYLRAEGFDKEFKSLPQIVDDIKGKLSSGEMTTAKLKETVFNALIAINLSLMQKDWEEFHANLLQAIPYFLVFTTCYEPIIEKGEDGS